MKYIASEQGHKVDHNINWPVVQFCEEFIKVDEISLSD